MIAGRSGSPNRRIMKPSAPMTSNRNRSKVFALAAYAPRLAKNRMPAYRYVRGIRSNRAHNGASGRFSTSSAVLPMNRLAIRPQTSCGSASNSRGPGWIP